MNSQNRQKSDAIWYERAEKVLHEVLSALPPDVRRCLDNVTVTLDPYPAEHEKIQAGDGEALLGLFVGTPYAEINENSDPVPCVIRLFVENLRDEAENNLVMFDCEVRKTLLHEIGHYIGLDEVDLISRGLA